MHEGDQQYRDKRMQQRKIIQLIIHGFFFMKKKKNLLRKECEQNESLLGITARPQMTKGSPDPFLSSPLKCSGKVQMAF